MNIRNQKISVTIPAYNEEKTIKKVVESAISSVSKISHKFEIVLVDDGSSDNTLKIMTEIKRRHGNCIRIIHHSQNQGFSGALKSCYQNAKGDLIFLGPADGQFDYSELNLFVNEIAHNDIVVAYRIFNEESRYRKLNSYLFHLLSRILFNIRLKEFSTCMLYSKKVRDSITIQARPSSALFLPEFFYKAIQNGYSIGQVPIHFYRRKGGKQKGSSPRVIISTLSEMAKFWLYIKFKVAIR